jgi:hypothetical protein
VCFEDIWIRTAFKGRGVPPQCTGNVAPSVRIRRRGKMRHDITDFPAGTGAGLRPGVLWEGGKVLLQPLGLGLDDGDQFCLGGHGVSLPTGTIKHEGFSAHIEPGKRLKLCDRIPSPSVSVCG